MTRTTVPDAPTEVTAVAGNAQATVRWTAPAKNGGSPITGYSVVPAPGGQRVSVAATETEVVVQGLANGTPYTFTVVATNSVGDSSPSAPSKAVTPSDVAPSGLSYSANPATYTKGTAIADNAPSTTGGGAVVSYSVTPDLPAGLSFDASTGVISGTPTAVTAAADYTVTATNSGGSAQTTLHLTVIDVAPSDLAYWANPATYTKGTAIPDNTPTSSGGPVVSYSVSPELPAGLSLDTSTGVLSGTPTVVTAAADYTVTATNSGGSTQAILSLTVNDVAPSGLSYSANPAIYTKGTAIADNTPTSSGGPVVSYSVSPELPAGLSFDASTGVLSGTPTAVTATGDYTVTATNTGGSTQATLSLTVIDVAPSDLTYSANSATYTKGTAIFKNTPSSSGGPVVSYSVSPELPAGLSLNASTGVISGTPTAVAAVADYTVTATNSGGSTQATLSLTVIDVAPSGLSYSANPATYTKGTAIADNTPTSSGGAVISYSVSPDLPAGLSLDASTGVITGTPTALTAAADYSVTATNTGGSTQATLSLTVNDVAPSGLTYSANPATYTKGTAVAENTPTSSGGAVISYSVSPDLPAGLSLDTSTGVITGTPTALSAAADYTVTATNTGGSTQATLSLTVNDVAPSGLTYSATPVTYLVNQAITDNTPTSSGGPVLSYSVTPDLPAGLSLDTSTGVLSGTPTAASAPADYTVTATNSGGSTTGVVSITVKGAPDSTRSTLTASPGSVPADGTSTLELTLVVRDSAGNLLAGQAVSALTSSEGSDSLSPTSGTTDSSGQFVSTVAASAIIGPRTFTAQVGSLSVTGDASFTAPVCPAPTLTFSVAAGSPLAVGTDPYATASGDFNGDGFADLAVANYTSNDISVLLGNGDGTFQPAQAFGAGTKPRSITGGDFNGDGKADLATANEGDNAVSVLLGNGDGSFQPASSYAAGTQPASTTSADFNGDGEADLAISNIGSNDVTVLLGNGDGTFQAPRHFGVGGSPYSLTSGDFDRDGNPDLATANYVTRDLSVLLGKGDGTFQAAQSFGAGTGPIWVTSDDLNRDGKADLISANMSSQDLSVLLGNGDGTFQEAQNQSVGTIPFAVTSADLNGDGKPDLISANLVSNSLNTLLGNGDGTFQAAQEQGPVYGPSSVMSADFDGNGRPDLAAVQGSYNYVSILLNGTPSPAYPGTFQSAGRAIAGPNATWTVSGDFNRDGRPDLATAVGGNGSTNRVSVMLGNGDGTFAAHVDDVTGAYPLAVATGDFNGDAKLDLATADTGDGTVGVLLGNGDGTFGPVSLTSVGSSPVFVVVADFNRDGRQDLAVTNVNGSNTLAVLLGNGDGSFSTPSFVTAADAYSATAGDFNHDGIPDLATANYSGQGVSVLLGNGDGTFQSPSSFLTGTAPIGIVTGDLNGDGHADLAVGNSGDANVSVLLGLGDGSFQSPTDFPLGQGPSGLALGDLNGDGTVDLAAAIAGSSGSDDVSLLFGNGDGSFQAPALYPAGDAAFTASITDLNGDGKPDLAVSNRGSNDVSVLLNTGCL